MPRVTTKASDIDSCGLTFSELQELWLGPHPTTGSCFCTREELVAAWAAGRAVVMRLWGRGGRRPAGFYEFEWSGPRPPYAVERSVLWRAAGVLSEAERTELESGWEAAFVEARGMAAQERREHYAHHDVPHELIKAWTADRRRRGRRPSTADSTATSAATSEGAAVK